MSTGEQWTVGRLLEWTTPYFRDRGIDSPRLDAELLLAHVLKVQRIELYTGWDRPVVQTELDQYRGLVQRRARREPVAYLLGSQGFHTLELKVDKRVLIPRPETELVVEKALAKLNGPVRILDVGTGSGAIVLALLAALPEARAVATDVSDEALSLAHDNAFRLGFLDRLELRHGAFFEPVRGERFSAIVSNPPYVETSAELSPDVKDFEPHTALFAGEDGLSALKTLLRGGGQHLEPGGWMWLEHGKGQAQALCAFAKDAGYENILSHDDLNGIDRVVEMTWTR